MVERKKWRQLKPGDLVDIVAPGFAVGEEEVKKALAFIKKLGLRARLPSQTIATFSSLRPSLNKLDSIFHAQTDEIRFELLQKALLAPDSQAIWCLRGGYGANRLLPFLEKNFKQPPAKIKIFIGLSDITSLHLYFYQKWGWPTLHGPLLDRLGAGLFPSPLMSELRELILESEGPSPGSLIFDKLKPLNRKAETFVGRREAIKAPIVGGNLTVLQSSLATPFQVCANKKFLFIEDIGERGYRIDRILEQFRQAGIFKNCYGLLVGHFIGGAEIQTKKELAFAAIQRFANLNELPVWTGLEVGHGDWQRVLPLGTMAEVKKDKTILKGRGVTARRQAQDSVSRLAQLIVETGAVNSGSTIFNKEFKVKK